MEPDLGPFFIEIPRFLLDRMEEDGVDQIPGIMMRIGLTDTRLTRALLRGDYPGAHTIIEETTDPDFLNDGAFQATPLNIVLGGPNGTHQKPRHLSLAKYLLEKGANPNLRIPSNDLETAYESPIELLLLYYLKLIETFGLPGSPDAKDTYWSMEETELMDCIGINWELGGLTPQTVISQTRELLIYCLEQGGDPNLPTTEGARTIYHLASARPITDHDLLQRMLDIGANVNHADVHNTTPLMDIISLGDQARTLGELNRLQNNNQVPLLDNQNCSRQSGLFRAAFKGQRDVVHRLLELGASPGLCARVQYGPRASALHAFRRPRKLSGIPPLLAPLLGNSPCTSWHVRRPRKSGRGTTAAPYWTVNMADQVTRTSISPLVDSGRLISDSVTETLVHLVTCYTNHPHVVNSKNVDPKAVIQLLFGQSTAGLRQLAVRAILKQALFSKSPQETLRKLKGLCEKKGLTLFRMMIEPSTLTTGSGARIAHDFILENGSELELSFNNSQGRDLDLQEEEETRGDSNSPGEPTLSTSEPTPSSNETTPSSNETTPSSNEPTQSSSEPTSSSLDPSMISYDRTQHFRANIGMAHLLPALSSLMQAAASPSTGATTPNSASVEVQNSEDLEKGTASFSSDGVLSKETCVTPSLSREHARHVNRVNPVGELRDVRDSNHLSDADPINIGDTTPSMYGDSCRLNARKLKDPGVDAMDVDAEVGRLDAQMENLQYADMLDNLDREYSVWLTRFTDLTRPLRSEGGTSHLSSELGEEGSEIGAGRHCQLRSFRLRHSSPDSGGSPPNCVGAGSLMEPLSPVFTSDLRFSDLEGLDSTERTKVMRQLMKNELKLQHKTDPGHTSNICGDDQLSQIDSQLDRIRDINDRTEEDISEVTSLLSALNGDADSRSALDAEAFGHSALDEDANGHQSRSVVQTVRRKIDENWSLGPAANLLGTTANLVGPAANLLGTTASLVETAASLLGTATRFYPPRDSDQQTSPQAQHDIREEPEALSHTVELVKSLEVSVSSPHPRQPSTTVMSPVFVQPDLDLQDQSSPASAQASEIDVFYDDIGANENAVGEAKEVVVREAREVVGDAQEDVVGAQEVFVEAQEVVVGAQEIEGAGPGGASVVISPADRQIVAGVVAPIDEDERSPMTTPSDLPELVEDSDSSDSFVSEDSDTWGGTFPLKHICCRTDYEEDTATESSIVSRLNPQVVEALTTELGIPRSLRPCFNLEAARLQLSLLLFNHHAIVCDRNCEGDDSEEDEVDVDETSTSDDDSSESEDADSVVLSTRSTPSLDRSLEQWAVSSTSSSTSSHFSSNLSVRSNFGSSVTAAETVVDTDRLSPFSGSRDDDNDDEDVWHSASSDSSGWLNSDLRRPAAADDLPRPAVTEEDGVLPRLAARDEGAGVLRRGDREVSNIRRRGDLRRSWLEDSEDLVRLRQFLGSSPPSDWAHSTSSEED